MPIILIGQICDPQPYPWVRNETHAQTYRATHQVQKVESLTKYLEHIGILLGCQDKEWCVPVHDFVTTSSTNMHMSGV
jgi:hypothetical protein